MTLSITSREEKHGFWYEKLAADLYWVITKHTALTSYITKGSLISPENTGSTVKLGFKSQVCPFIVV